MEQKQIPTFVLDKDVPIRLPWRVIALCGLAAVAFWLWVFAVLAAF